MEKSSSIRSLLLDTGLLKIDSAGDTKKFYDAKPLGWDAPGRPLCIRISNDILQSLLVFVIH